jgi:hypothetical protein
MLARPGPPVAFLLRAGAEWDLGAHVSGDGIASGLEADLSSHLGFVGDIGLWYQSSNQVSMTLTFRYNRMTYSAAGGNFAASNAGAMLGVVLDPR